MNFGGPKKGEKINMVKKFWQKANIIGDCFESGVSVWECPAFLFVLIGIIDAVVTVVIFFVSQRFDDPIFTVMSLAGTNIFILGVGSIIVKAQEKIVRANKIRSEFISIVSHQFRSPLGGVRWAADLLKSSRIGNLSDKQKEFVESIQKNNDRMLMLVNDLLDASRISEGKMEVIPREVSAEEILRQAVADYNFVAKVRDIDLILNIEDGLPLAFIDPARIKIAVQNLIDNAIKYTKNKGEIKIYLFKLKDNLLFKIEDSGVGIPKGQQSEIFDKFFRSDNILKNEIKGTGLGLYIVKAAVESNGGKIWFESKENKGSKFYFTVPIAK